MDRNEKITRSLYIWMNGTSMGPTGSRTLTGTGSKLPTSKNDGGKEKG